MQSRQDWLLLTLSKSPGGAMSPVQIQKSLFLFGREAGSSIGTHFYSFVPYDYGPFDAAICVDLRRMEREGHVTGQWSPGRSWKNYTLTGYGRKTVRLLGKRRGRPSRRIPRTNRCLGQGTIVLESAPQRLRCVPGIRGKQRVSRQVTVLVGILASDGAAVAADRQVTVGHVGLPTQKISPIGGDSLIASCGSLALGQKIRMVFETHHADLKTHSYAENLPAIEQGVRVVVTPTLQMAEKTRYVVPGAENNALACSLACIPFVDGLRLCHVDYDGSIYCLDENLPYVTAGSGKINADPFIRFIWDVFWPDPGHLPPLREAIFAAYWTVQMNIEYQSTGVGIGVDVWTVNRNGDGSYAAAETDRRDWSRPYVHRKHEAGHAGAARPHLRSRRSRGGHTAEAVMVGYPRAPVTTCVVC